MKFVKQYFWNLGVCLSRLACNLFFAQNANKSLSELCGEISVNGGRNKAIELFFMALQWVVDGIFYLLNGEQNHCVNEFLTPYDSRSKDVVELSYFSGQE